MRYDASKPLDVNKAKAKFEHLINNGKVFDLTEKKPLRTLPQNRYLHLILSWFAVETGYTLEEVKQDIFKKHVNHDVFYDGEVGKLNLQRWRSTAALDTAELTVAIDRFRNFASSELGIYLPDPNDLASLQEMENEIERKKQFI